MGGVGSLRQRYGLLVVPLGVLAGHAIGYWLAHPVELERATALGDAHGYFGAATSASLVLAALAMGLAGLEGWRGHRSGHGAARLLRTQALVFVAVELMERADAANPLVALAQERAVWIGLAVQGLVALGAAFLLRSSGAVAERLRRHRAVRSTAETWDAPASTPITKSALVASVGRGPPVAVAA